MVAGPAETGWRWTGHGHHGHRFRSAVRHVRHGSGKRAARAHGGQPVGHSDLSGGRLSGVRGVHHGAPVSEGVRAGTRLLPDGYLARLLDGVQDGGAHDAGVEDGVRAIRPGRV